MCADKPLTCNTDYAATQRVEGVEGDTVEFSTKACDAPEAPAAPVIKGATATEASGTGEPGATVTLRAVMQPPPLAHSVLSDMVAFLDHDKRSDYFYLTKVWEKATWLCSLA